MTLLLIGVAGGNPSARLGFWMLPNLNGHRSRLTTARIGGGCHFHPLDGAGQRPAWGTTLKMRCVFRYFVGGGEGRQKGQLDGIQGVRRCPGGMYQSDALSCVQDPQSSRVVLWPLHQGGESTVRCLYMVALLADIARKTCLPIAGAIPGTSSQRLREILTNSKWDHDRFSRQRVKYVSRRATYRGGNIILESPGRVGRLAV